MLLLYRTLTAGIFDPGYRPSVGQAHADLITTSMNTQRGPAAARRYGASRVNRAARTPVSIGAPDWSRPAPQDIFSSNSNNFKFYSGDRLVGRLPGSLF